MKIKQCCSRFYEDDLTIALFGNSLHPGGLKLTKKLCQVLQIRKDSKVLDVACGNGTSALYIAKESDCKIIGTDLGKNNIKLANKKAKEQGISHLTKFMIRDSEKLNFNGEFDFIISECAFCTFPNKDIAAKEMFKALKPNGKLGISDMVVNKIPDEMKTELYKILCIADAKDVDGYKEIFERNNFKNFRYVDAKESLINMVNHIKKRIFALELFFNLETNKKLNFRKGKKLIKNMQSLIEEGNMSYGLITAKKYE